MITSLSQPHFYICIDNAINVYIQKSRNKLFNFNENTTIQLQDYNSKINKLQDSSKIYIIVLNSKLKHILVVVEDVL